MIFVKRVFHNVLVVSPFGDGKYWYLREELLWLGLEDRQIRVPAGFVTDFASVPRPVWWLFPPWAQYGNAAVVHDWLYWTQPFQREVADQAIAEGMHDMGVGRVAGWLIYRALRLFGGFGWKANACARAAGEKRCIADFPSDARVTWSDYRMKHGVDCPAPKPRPEGDCQAF